MRISAAGGAENRAEEAGLATPDPLGTAYMACAYPRNSLADDHPLQVGILPVYVLPDEVVLALE